MKNNKFNLENKTALITGSAGLLGSQHAEALLQNGANIILTDIDKEHLSFTKAKLQKKYSTSKINMHIMDVTDLDSIQNTEKKFKELSLRIDILINNASLNPKFENKNTQNFSSLEDFTIDQWNLDLNVGLMGSFLCTKVFGSTMSKDGLGGVILNISSDLSVISPNQNIYKSNSDKENLNTIFKPISYSVIKSGLIGMTKYVATYWADKGVRCNALSPGGVYNNQDKEFVKKISKLIPLNRMAKLDEYQSAIQFLCSDASSYLNGQNIVMDGGRSIW